MKAFERIKSFAEYVGDVTNLRARPILRASQYDGLFYREADLAGRTGIAVASSRWDSVWLSVDRLAASEPPAPPADIVGWIEVGSDLEQEPSRQDHITVNLPADEAETFVASGRVQSDDVQLESKGDDDVPTGDRRADVTLRLEAFPELAAKIDNYVEGAWRDWATQEIPKRETMKIYDELLAFGKTTNSGEGSAPTELVWGVGALRWDNEKLGAIDHPVIEIPLEVDIEKMSEKISIRPRWQSVRIAESFLGSLPGDGLAEFIKSEGTRISELIEVGEKITPFRKESFEPILLNCAARIDPVGVYRPRSDGQAWDGGEADASPQPIVSDAWSLYVRPKVEPVAVDDAEAEPAPAEEKDAEFAATEGAGTEPEARIEDDAPTAENQPEPESEPEPSNASDEGAEPESPEPDRESAPPRELPSIEISLAGPVSKRGAPKFAPRPMVLAAIGGLALVGIALAIYTMMPSKEEREVQRQQQTLATVEGSQPSGLSPRGELADYFNLTSRRTDDQRADKEQAIKGEIVQWSLPVQSVSRQQDGVYRVQTSAFMDTVGTVVTLHARNDAERQIVEGLETGDWITIKGKIRGVASHDVEIIDAIPIAK